MCLNFWERNGYMFDDKIPPEEITGEEPRAYEEVAREELKSVEGENAPVTPLSAVPFTPVPEAPPAPMEENPPEAQAQQPVQEPRIINTFESGPAPVSGEEPKPEEPKAPYQDDDASGQQFPKFDFRPFMDGEEPPRQEPEQPETPPQQGWQPPPYTGGYTPYNNYNNYNNYGSNQNGQNGQPYNPQQPASYSPVGGFQGNSPPVPPKKSTGFRVFIGLVAALVLVATTGLSAIGIRDLLNGGTTPGGSQTQEGDVVNPNGPSLQINEDSKASDIVGSDGISHAQIAKAVRPSVVGVLSYDTSNYGSQGSGGQGSGIIMSEDGYIVTNAHVVAQKSNFVQVVLEDGTKYQAKVVGLDTRTDLGVLKIDPNGKLTAAKFGDSDQLEVGETVMAIGNPGGLMLAGSVTQGIVSAVNRPIVESGMQYIQTDAAINPGNSGGALVNAKGYIIGINSSKIVAEGFEGIGFAIPINTAKPIVDDIIKFGSVQGRAVLGITGQTIDDMMATQWGVEPGVLIQSVSEKSDIQNHDIRQNDIITKIDDVKVTNIESIHTILEKKKPGETVKMTIYRQGRGSTQFTVKLIQES